MHGAAFQGTSSLNPDYDQDSFRPHPLARNGHLQTILSHLLPRRYALPAPEERRFRVADDVHVVCLCHWQRPREAALTLVLVHGLEGSSESQYMLGAAAKAWAAGMNVVRMNVRGCGAIETLCPTLYHSGMSADVGEVVRALIQEERLARIVLAGFSMGGNQVLKLAGEWGRDHTLPAQLLAIAAVSPAMDLAPSADALHLLRNRLYEWRFLFSLRARLRRKQRLFPGRYRVDRWWWNSIRDFDDCVTAPYCGFADAADYYAQASASRLLEHISVPTLIIHAADDPFIRMPPETRAKIQANPHIRFVETRHGGHCGFLAAKCSPAIGRINDDGRWAERRIVEFLARVAPCGN